MLIDWFTVGAQVVNFLILIVLLKRFLYRPLLAALDRREQGIQEQIERADQARAQAETEAADLARERQQLAAAKEQLLAAARNEAAALKEEEFDRARAEVAAKREQWLAGLAEEEQAFLQRVRLNVGELTFLLCRKVLRDLAGVELEQQLMELLLVKEGTIAAPENSNGLRITVRSGFPLSDEAQQGLISQLTAAAPGSNAAFEVDPGLGFGLEIIAGDRKTAWNMSRYLEEIESEARTLLHARPKEEAHG